MHSLACYRIRCFDKEISSKNKDDKYISLDNVRNKDTFLILKEFFKQNLETRIRDDHDKSVHQFDAPNFNDEDRVISGWMKLGHYGIKSDIIDVKTGDTDYNKDIDKAEMVNYYYHITLPRGKSNGIVLFHRINGNSIKTKFFNAFSEYFKTSTNLTLQIKAISPSNAVVEWHDALAKEISIIGVGGAPIKSVYNDIADEINCKLNSHKKTEVTVTVSPGRNHDFGKYQDILFKKDGQPNIIEILTPVAKKIKVTFEKNKRRKAFIFGTRSKDFICDIELPEDLIDIKTGIPTEESILKFCNEVAEDFKN
jgi:hypothetical protein